MNSISSRPHNNSRALISVVVPMRNEDAQAMACLESLATLSYEPLEIVVVDDRSSDETAGVARTYLKQDARFKLISLEGEPVADWSGKARAADAGIRASSGEVLVVADADVRHGPSSAAVTLRELESHEFVVGLPRATGHGLAAWCARYLYELLYLASDERQCFAFGAYTAFTRDFYERVGGWASAPGHPEVMALAAAAPRAGIRPLLVRRDDLSMEQFRSLGEASYALLRNTNYRLAPPRPMVRTIAIVSLCWVGVSFIPQAPLIGSVMLLCYCALMGFAWRRYGIWGIVGGFCFALPGALWFTSVSLYSMLWQAVGGAVSWRGRSFVR